MKIKRPTGQGKIISRHRSFARLAIFSAFFITIMILNLATALAYYQSHNLSEIRNIDADLNMSTYDIRVPNGGICVDNDGSCTPVDGRVYADYFYSNTLLTNIDISGVTAGNGLTGGATSGTATLNVGAGSCITVGASDVGVTPNCVGAATATNIAGGSAGAIPFQTAASTTGFDASDFYWDDGNNRLGIGTASPTYDLDVAGDIGVDEYIHHNDDVDTYIMFWDDTMYLFVGNVPILYASEGTQDTLVVNDLTYDVDFRVESVADENSLFVDGNGGNVGIGIRGPAAKLHINNTGSADSFRVDDSSGDTTPFVVSNAGRVGISTTSPASSLDVRGDEVRIWDGSATINYATSEGELYVENDAEVDGTLYAGTRVAAGAAGSSNYALYGAGTAYGVYGTGSSYGVYGYVSNGVGVQGYVGTTGVGVNGTGSNGVWGCYKSACGSRYGYLGGPNEGLYAQYGENYARVGANNVGIESHGRNYGVRGRVLDTATGWTFAGEFVNNYGDIRRGIYASATTTGTNYSGYFNGNIYVSGSCTGCDIAEKMATRDSLDHIECDYSEMPEDIKNNSEMFEQIKREYCKVKDFDLEFESGAVICVDDGDSELNLIKTCNGAYDRGVMSVVNYEATQIIGRPDYPYPVSLAGNVPVNVICDKPIKKGDSLVTADEPGYAMKLDLDDPEVTWKHAVGTVFAKALTECDGSEKYAQIRAWLNAG